MYLQFRDNYFKVQLEKDLHLPVSYHAVKFKAQPLEYIHHNESELSQQSHPH